MTRLLEFALLKWGSTSKIRTLNHWWLANHENTNFLWCSAKSLHRFYKPNQAVGSVYISLHNASSFKTLSNYLHSALSTFWVLEKPRWVCIISLGHERQFVDWCDKLFSTAEIILQCKSRTVLYRQRKNLWRTRRWIYCMQEQLVNGATTSQNKPTFEHWSILGVFRKHWDEWCSQRLWISFRRLHHIL